MARKKTKVDDGQLVSMVNGELFGVRTNAYSLISSQRIDANYSFANQQTSHTVPTTNMSGTIFSFSPSVVNTLTMHQSKIFCSDKKTVDFMPASKDEVISAGAKQLSMMVNTVLHRSNPGFDIITEMFRSAAVNKVSVAKVGWDEEKEIQEIELTDVNPIQLDEMVAYYEGLGYEVKVKQNELIESSITEIAVDPETGEQMELEVESSIGSYTLRIERTKGRIKVDVIPPEEFVINEDTTSINDDPMTRFVAQRKDMLRADVKVMFPKVDVDKLADYGDLYEDYEKRARHEWDGTLDLYGGEGREEDVNRVTITESWIRADRDGDGYPEWRHVFTCGGELLHDEEWFGPLPFTSFTFFPVPHKFYGLSVYDKLHRYDETATSLVRSDVDMARLKNTFRLFAKDGAVDRRMLQSGKPGIVPVANTFDPNDVMVVPTPSGSGNTIPMIEELRKQVIADVGIDPISGAVSSDIEKSGNDATKTQMAMDNATVKVEGYSRRFAEGALKDIAWNIAYLLVQYKDEEFVKDIVEAVTPDRPFLLGEIGLTTALAKTDLVSKVGLGHQSGQQKLAALTTVAPLLQQLEASPSRAFYNLLSSALEGLGYENPEEVIGSLDHWKSRSEEQKAMAANQAQMQQQQLAIQQQEAQHRMSLASQQFEFQKQLDNQKAEAEIMYKQAQAMLAEAKALREPQEQSLEERKFSAETEIETVQERPVSL